MNTAKVKLRTNLPCPRPLVRYCHFGIAPVTYSDSDISDLDPIISLFAVQDHLPHTLVYVSRAMRKPPFIYILNVAYARNNDTDQLHKLISDIVFCSA